MIWKRTAQIAIGRVLQRILLVPLQVDRDEVNPSTGKGVVARTDTG